MQGIDTKSMPSMLDPFFTQKKKQVYPWKSANRPQKTKGSSSTYHFSGVNCQILGCINRWCLYPWCYHHQNEGSNLMKIMKIIQPSHTTWRKNKARIFVFQPLIFIYNYIFWCLNFVPIWRRQSCCSLTSHVLSFDSAVQRFTICNTIMIASAASQSKHISNDATVRQKQSP